MIKKWGYPLLIILLFEMLILLALPSGALYGSNIDWLNQHVALGETIRTACMEQKTLLPGFLNLGGGSNGFQFAYYGYLRPDILIGCLMPQVPMEKIIIAYMLAGYLSSSLLFFYLLKAEGSEDSMAFWGSIIFMTAACFFQTHRQIMFINYMPYLLLALMAVKKERDRALSICFLLIFLHSFYFSIACLFAVLWYGVQARGKRFFLIFLKTAVLSIGMAAALLLPTGLVILEHKRASGAMDMASVLSLNRKLESMLYTPYGMGLTAVCLYTLLLGLTSKKYRRSCLFYLIISSWGMAAYLLNGTLYARGKILIPFTPLVVLECTKILRDLLQGKMKWQLWPFLILVWSWLKYQGSWKFSWMAADVTLLFGIVLWRKGRSGKKVHILWNYLLLIMPVLFFLRTARTELFVSSSRVQELAENREETRLVQILEKNPLYRFDSLRDSLNTGNRDASEGRWKSTMYSSITNKDLSSVYYDILQTPIQISNRVALLTADNPFLLHFMGIRCLEMQKGQVPDGYRVIAKSGNTVLAENKSVLPIAYLSDQVIQESTFQELKPLEKMEAIIRSNVVPDTGIAKEKPQRETVMKVYKPDWARWEIPDGIRIERAEEKDSGEEGASYQITAEKSGTVSARLKSPIEEAILLLQFTVVNQTGREVIIDINAVRNKLSGRGEAYPNKNTEFHYQLSKENGIEVLQITFTKGNYLIKNIRWHTFPKESLQEKKIREVEPLGTEGYDILACKAKSEEDCYFITSIPKQKGMELWIDGKKAEVLKVNEAFAGAKLKKGVHEIKLKLIPPGLEAGFRISVLCFTAWLIDLLFEFRRRHISS